jgi:hypothetical protein
MRGRPVDVFFLTRWVLESLVLQAGAAAELAGRLLPGHEAAGGEQQVPALPGHQQHHHDRDHDAPSFHPQEQPARHQRARHRQEPSAQGRSHASLSFEANPTIFVFISLAAVHWLKFLGNLAMSL